MPIVRPNHQNIVCDLYKMIHARDNKDWNNRANDWTLAK